MNFLKGIVGLCLIVYHFGGNSVAKMTYRFQEGKKEWKDLLGGKGANLCEMTKLDLPVPSGFIVSTDACRDYLAQESKKLSPKLIEEIILQIKHLEALSSKTFGIGDNPLLVSVRSGAKFSMPGMMDTILNLGLNDQTVHALSAITGNVDFAFQCYCRLIQMFADVVYGVSAENFGVTPTGTKSEKEWQQTVQNYQKIYAANTGQSFPQNTMEQLIIAVEAVFTSWNNQRAKVYRRLHNISDALGTAVTIQQMVFGNYSADSATGVMFTRNPATGEKGVYGEFLLQAQGEDIVAGIRTPEPIRKLAGTMPYVYDELLKIATQLENHYQDMQDVEFTIEAGKLYMLQTRNGKRTPQAAVTIAYNLMKEGIISTETMINRIDEEMIEKLLHPTFTKEARQKKAIVQGLPASPGASVGQVAFTAESAKEMAMQGRPVILVRNETSPEDIEGMSVSEAIVTSRGGMTSHAAVVARGMGICCVVGCEALQVDESQGVAYFAEGQLKTGDVISVDGSSGRVYRGKLPLNEATTSAVLEKVLKICDSQSTLAVYGNAETPRDIKESVKKGAKGIGLARTEHMFFKANRLKMMRQLILADNPDKVNEALSYMKEEQKADFCQMYQILGELPCTIRLLDPPLHEFLPQEKKELREIAQDLAINSQEVLTKAQRLAEINPMLGLRGVRLGITRPEIYQMQVGAIIEAAIEISIKEKITIIPHIMIPLVGTVKELSLIKKSCLAVIEAQFKDSNMNLPFKIGTMIEIPRACLIADQLAQIADFFSFGTNDLTQLTYGYSRDDAHKFLSTYTHNAILPSDPFQHLDAEGVGKLMRFASEKGKEEKESLSIGVCGEVGGDPASIQFIQTLPVDYVSCSPFRIPQARLACAKAAIAKKKSDHMVLV